MAPKLLAALDRDGSQLGQPPALLGSFSPYNVSMFLLHNGCELALFITHTNGVGYHVTRSIPLCEWVHWSFSSNWFRIAKRFFWGRMDTEDSSQLV